MTSDALSPSPLGLEAEVIDVFATEGPLARLESGYRPRSAQIQLARAVAQALERRQVLVAEAGTGVGKTYAYLVPVLLAGLRVVVSTATKALQDQLFLRDLPRLTRALGLPVQAALLKGRGAYLCLHRLEEARHRLPFPADPRMLRDLGRVEVWARTTLSGDMAEVAELDERTPVRSWVTSSRDNCLGGDCPRLRDCHVLKARREALQADVVVVNHALFFADMSLRDGGLAELLPQVDAVVLDEAHQLNEIGVQFLGRTLASGAWLELGRDLLAVGLTKARGLQDWRALSGRIERQVRLWALTLAESHGRRSGRLRWDDVVDRPDFRPGLQALMPLGDELLAALEPVRGMDPELERLFQRAQSLTDSVRLFDAETPPHRVRWVDVLGSNGVLTEAPLDLREALREPLAKPGRAWVMTSATLGETETLDWFTRSLGLKEAQTLRVESPFDYATQARLWVPEHLPRPQDAAHSLAVAAVAAQCVRQLGGRTFVLTTSLRALGSIGEALHQHFVATPADVGPAVEILVQGHEPRRALLARFVAAGREGRAAVLVGSQSFWEGIDVPGVALQCVVIDKLPFPVPDDPWMDARAKACQAEGGDAFRDVSLPETAIALKQGAGRLIRSESDLGLLVICDVRLVRMFYGRRLIKALPPMPRLGHEDQAMAWLRQLRTYEA
ncbi:ATP-dependent DNA helicase [Leptothrix ochracea]|uniref:ATP-dependent DNA helicase n=1 Tax=Leptothrix ochracea TaxID=735331 RepID=UPI0034E29774